MTDRTDTLPPPIAYLYHDAATASDVRPWVHSILLVLAAYRRPHYKGETALHPEDTVRRLLAAKDERIRVLTEALNKIACYPEGPVSSSMDEPHAAAIARAALEIRNG